MTADILVAWNVMNYFHPYLSDQNVFWDAELPKVLAQALKSETYDSRPIKLMTAQLNDAHVNLYLPDGDKQKIIKYLPLRVRKMDDKMVVTYAVDSLFHRGDVIESVNGKDAIAYYRYFEDERSGGSHYKAEKAEGFWLRSFGEHNTVTLSIRRGNQKINITTTPIERETYLRAMKSTFFGGESRWIDDETLYLNLSNTNFDRIQKLLKIRTEDQTVCVFLL